MSLTMVAAPIARATPAFVDADGCARWLRGVPVSDIAKHYEALYGQLAALTTAEIAPRERARVAELMREQVMFLHAEFARRYAGKPQPLTERELEAAEQAAALWTALWEQYSACLKPLLEGEAELQGVKAKLLQRGLWTGKQLVLVYGLARRQPPASVWQELHAYYRLAEMLECAGTAVTDELMPNAVGLSCYSTYMHALLLNLADPCAMTVRQIELTDRWLGLWARKVFPYAQQRESEGPVIVIDLDVFEGAKLFPMSPGKPTESMRYGYPAKLVTSVRGRLKRLSTGANPAELQLGHDVSVEICAALLSHLDACWYAVRRKNTSPVESDIGLCVGGLAAVYFRLAGRTFSPRDVQELSYQGSQQLATLGAVADYDRNKEEADRSWAWERWQGPCGVVEAVLQRIGGGQHRWHLEQLVVLRVRERIRCGHVTRVVVDAKARLSITLKLWPGTPAPLALRALSAIVSEEPAIPAVMLTIATEEKPFLILAPRTFSPARVLCTVASGTEERRFRLTRLVQRGADFERVAFEECAA